MKDKKLPVIKDEDLISFNFKKPTVSEEQIKKHWEAIAKKIATGAEYSDQSVEQDKGNNKTTE